MRYCLPVVLDCEAGRRLGCATLCCRLIVRLGPDESDPGGPRRPMQSCVDKDPRDGLCVYIDRKTGLCTVWERRPRVCRGYDCNRDPLLRIVLERGFSTLTQLVRSSAESLLTPSPAVSYLSSDDDGEGPV